MIFVVNQRQLANLVEQLTKCHQINEGTSDLTTPIKEDLVGVSLHLVLPKPSSGSATSFECPHCGDSITVSK